jgi:uncharacterized membrane protein YdfJ with MMPL/SSD domain
MPLNDNPNGPGTAAIGWVPVHGRLAAGIARRPGWALAANVALLAVATALAAGALDRLAVAGGLGSHARSNPALLVVTAESRPALGGAVARQALTVIRARLDADPRVADVETADLGGRSRRFVLEVRLTELPADERQSAAEEIAEGIDPGPLEVAVGGETMVQAAARDRLEDELGGLALLATPLVVVALLLGFGVRHAVAPLVAGATGALGAVAILGLLAGAMDLGVAGIASAVAVGLAIGTESCAVLRRGFGSARAGPTEARFAATLERTGRSVAVAVAGGALAALAILAIALPAARSAAIGGALAALLAGASALIAMPSVLALAPGAGKAETPPSRRGARLRDALAVRPWLAWLPAVIVVAALAIAAVQSFDPEVRTGVAGDIPASSEAARAAELVAKAASEEDAGTLLAAPERAGPFAREEIRAGLPLIAALVTALGLIGAYLATRSWREAFARGIATALPALAVVGILNVAGEGSLPLGLDLGRLSAPQASALLVVLAAVGAISAARAALGDARTALAGTVVGGVGLAALAGSDLAGVAQAGIAVAAGLVLDLVLVRAVLVPCLDHALPRAPPRVRLPRLPDRLRR